MVNVLDTHRLQYRNAVLRAYDAANPTTRIDFFNGDVNIGNEVYTNENGYLFYEAGGRQPIENLNVNGSAIIKVSLDDGHHFGITWQVDDKTSLYVEESDIHNMTYRGSDNTRKTWQPLQADCVLPDYLLKSEYHDGVWGEQEIAIGTDTSVITLEDWAHVITILTTAPNTITISNPRMRAGQAVIIIAKKNCTLNIVTGPGAPVAHSVYAGRIYVLVNRYETENTTAGLSLIDITGPTMYSYEITGDDLYSDDNDTTVKANINIGTPIGCFPLYILIHADSTKAAWANKKIWLIVSNDAGGSQLLDTSVSINGTSPYGVTSSVFANIWHYRSILYHVRLV